MRVKVPCDDEADFYARLADRIAENGLRIPAERPRQIGERLSVALEFRDGGTLSGEAVVAAYVRLDHRAGLNVRFVRFDDGPAGQHRPRAPGPSRAPPPPVTPAVQSLGGDAAVPSPFGDAPVPEVAPDEFEMLENLEMPGDPQPAPAPARAPRAGSRGPWWRGVRGWCGDQGQRAAQVWRAARLWCAVQGWPAVRGWCGMQGRRTVRGWRAVRASRAMRGRRGAVVAAAVALALAVLGYAIVRRLATPEAEAAAHLAAAEKQLAAGHVSGADGALAHLLAAKRLRPQDPVPAARLADAADMLELLGTRALGRGDLDVASIHLEAALVAAPERTSILKKLDSIAKYRRSPGSAARGERRPGGAKH